METEMTKNSTTEAVAKVPAAGNAPQGGDHAEC